MKKFLVLLAALGFTGVAFASTTFDLPNDAFSVNPNWSNTTTIVTVGATVYRGPSQFYYVGECAKADGPRYHCNVMREDQVVLTAPNGSTIMVSLTAQFASILVISGHNHWNNIQIVVTPSTVTLP